MNISAVSAQSYTEAQFLLKETPKSVEGELSLSYEAEASVQFMSEGQQYEMLLQATVEVNIQSKIPLSKDNLSIQPPKVDMPDIDLSPEATAQRIVDMATAAFGRFQSQNQEGTIQETLNQFMETIKSGIEQGFEEAKDILKQMDLLEGDIASNIDKTYELVQQKLSTYEQDTLALIESSSLEPSNNEQAVSVIE